MKRKGAVGENRRKQQKLAAEAELRTGAFGGNWDDTEQSYEMVPRKSERVRKVVEGLPIKGSDGRVTRVVRHEESEEEEASEEEEEKEEEAERPAEDAEAEESEEEATPLPTLKETIAQLVSDLTSEPEEHLANLHRLRKMSRSKNPATCQLSLLALVPAFKAICPLYRIRALTDAERREKVSKDVARSRQFEQLLVGHYKLYVETLTEYAKVSVHTAGALPFEVNRGRLATTAACELAAALRHFNFRNEVFTVVIRRLNRKPADEGDLKVFRKAVQTLEQLLADDQASGDISFDIARLLTKSIKDKKFRVDESVVNVLLSLSVLSDYDPHSNDKEEKPKMKKKDRVHLSKKQRKALKETRAIEDELRKAEHAVLAEERERFQAQILKMLLQLYFEMLKHRPEHLMAAVLEGLARHAHMANLDLMGDFMEVLREVVRDTLAEDEPLVGTRLRQVLLATVTAFSLVALNHQYKRLKVLYDYLLFIQALYHVTPYVGIDPDVELSHKLLRLADPLAAGADPRPAVNVSTVLELYLRGLNHVFFLSRNGTPARACAFVKKIYMLLAHCPEKLAVALLKFVDKLSTRHSEIAGLWSTDDRVASTQGFDMDGDDLEYAYGDQAVVWECVFLEKHYAKEVTKAARLVAQWAAKENKD